MIITRTLSTVATAALALTLAASCGTSTPPQVSAPTLATVSVSQPPTVQSIQSPSPTPSPVSTAPPAAMGVSQTNTIGTVATVYSVADWVPPATGAMQFQDPGVVVDVQVDINNTQPSNYVTSSSWTLSDTQNHIYTPSYSGPTPEYPSNINLTMGHNIIRGLLKFDTGGVPAAGLTVRYWPSGAPYAPLLWTSA